MNISDCAGGAIERDVAFFAPFLAAFLAKVFFAARFRAGFGASSKDVVSLTKNLDSSSELMTNKLALCAGS
jgi:hypothetical protein